MILPIKTSSSFDDNDKLFSEWQQTKSNITKQRLVQANMRLVLKIAKNYFINNSSNSYDDLVQEGAIGLIKSIEEYNPDFGVPFSHYAAKWIRAHMLKYIFNNWSLIKTGTTPLDQKIFWNFAKCQRSLEHGNSTAYLEELAKKFNVSVDKVRELTQKLDTKFFDIDYEDPHTHQKNNKISRILKIDSDLEPDNQFLSLERSKLISGQLTKFLARLNPRDRFIFKKRFLIDEPETLEAIGKRFNVKKQRIEQITRRLLHQCKKFLKHDKNLK